MDPLAIIDRHYASRTVAREILLEHSRAVAKMALEVARRASHLKPDMKFIEEAAMLHDIGMFLTDMPQLGCQGSEPYISHGVLGRNLLEEEGLDRHALVCERHVGVGLTVEDIRAKGFPIPERDMVPLSLEEQIICFADKFFSKVPGMGEKPLSEARAQIAGYGEEKLRVFDKWVELFKLSNKGILQP